MKNKLLLAGILVLAMAVVFKVGMVLGEGGVLIVCKSNGGILMARENCPSGMQTYELAVGSGGSGGGSLPGTVGSGYIRFMNHEGLLLSSDGNIWKRDAEFGEWTKFLSKIDIVTVDSITYWIGQMFIAEGKIYKLDGTNWNELTNLPTPTL